MRITNSMMINKMMTNMNSNLGAMDKWQNDLSSGVKIHRPSDDPVLVARSLKIHTDIAETEQFTRNVDDAYSFLDKTETSLKELTNVVQRVRELTAQASNGVLTPEDTQKIESEITQLKDHMVKIGNDTYVGRHIFSGFNTDKKLLAEDGTMLLTDTAGQDVEYQVGVSGKVKVNVTGEEVFGDIIDSDGDGTADEGLMGSMDRMISLMDGGDHEEIASMLDDLDVHLDNLNKLRGDVGARMNTVEVIKERGETMTLNFANLLSQTEDTDMGEAVMNLSMREAVYKASLSVGARVIQPTLIDFLR